MMDFFLTTISLFFFFLSPSSLSSNLCAQWKLSGVIWAESMLKRGILCFHFPEFPFDIVGSLPLLMGYFLCLSHCSCCCLALFKQITSSFLILSIPLCFSLHYWTSLTDKEFIIQTSHCLWNTSLLLVLTALYQSVTQHIPDQIRSLAKIKAGASAISVQVGR